MRESVRVLPYPGGRPATAAVVVAVAVTVALVAPAPAAAAKRCDRVAAPSGSDRAAGTKARPFRTFQRLAGSLRPGRVGCLRRGVYEERNVRVTRGGTRSHPTTLRSFPGERAVHRGRLWIAGSANHVRVARLILDGSRAPACPQGGSCSILPSPVVNGNFARFVENRITNRNRATCLNLGSSDWGRAVGTTIRGNRIHHCGRFPRTNHDHGIYVQRADRTRIVDNLIHRNADRGIQLYPDAQHTTIADNLIDSNGTGVQFSGAHGTASSNNLVERSVITRSARYNVSTWYPLGTPAGSGNVVRSSCLAEGGLGETSGGSLAILPSVRFGPPCPPLTLALGRKTVRSRGRLPVSGWWRAGRSARSRVELEVHRGGGWREVRSARVRSGGRYTARLSARRLLGRSTAAPVQVRVRARLPGVGTSWQAPVTIVR